MTLLTMWLMYTVFGTTFFSLVFLWAVRTRQFAGQDRARYLPLEPLEPADTPKARVRWPGRVLWVPVALLVIAALALGGSAWWVLAK